MVVFNLHNQLFPLRSREQDIVPILPYLFGVFFVCVRVYIYTYIYMRRGV